MPTQVLSLEWPASVCLASEPCVHEMPSAMKCANACAKMNEVRWCLMYAVAFQAWLLGALEFSTVPTTHPQAPEVPVCGWWAKGKDDGVLGTKDGCFFV